MTTDYDQEEQRALAEQMRRELFVFDPVPHEVEAREQFIRLFTEARQFEQNVRRPGGGPRMYLQAYAPEGTVRADDINWPERPEWQDYSQLRKRVLDWRQTWRSLAARNPPLELLECMEDVYYDDPMGPAFGWRPGTEPAFDDWVARGIREPVLFGGPMVTEAYYERLRELRSRSNGWWYWKHEVQALVWAPSAEWTGIAARIRQRL